MTNLPSDEFQDACLQACNALRLARHAIHRGGSVSIEDNTLVLETFQTTTAFTSQENAIVVTVNPKPGIDDRHKLSRFILEQKRLPGSLLFSALMDELPDLFASYIEEIEANGVMYLQRYGDEDCCILFTPAHGSQGVITQYVEAICRGIDAKYEPNNVLLRHPGFGVKGALEMFTPDMQVATPAEDSSDPEDQACAARLNMAKRWVHHLNPAIRVIPAADQDTFILEPFALTFAAPEDRSQAMSNASKAYMHLAAIVQSQADARA